MRRQLLATLGAAAAGALVAVVALSATVGLGPGPGARDRGTAGPADGPSTNAGTPTGTSAAAPSASAPLDATAAATEFLETWVQDGRTVRRDQGGDTVSEGQAYALLLAVAADDRATFDAVWQWTEDHLLRADGLLAWRWADGAVVEPEPATDADLDAARALVLAGERWREPGWTEAGAALATTVMDRLTVVTGAGRILLPGLWATATDPYAYNPSYASPAAFAVLGQATGDPRWEELALGSAQVTTQLLDKAALPPDWAQVHGDGTAEAMPGAYGTGDQVRFGYDAARVPVRFAESCTETDVALSARTAGALDRAEPVASELDLGGGALTEASGPLGYVARSAARAAAGAPDASADLVQASRLAAAHPTYYGAAWQALGTVVLTSDVLGGCPALEGER